MSEKQAEARLAEIRENRRVWYGGQGQVTKDIDYLLSLLQQPASSERCARCGHLRNDPKRRGSDEFSSFCVYGCGCECMFPATSVTSGDYERGYVDGHRAGARLATRAATGAGEGEQRTRCDYRRSDCASGGSVVAGVWICRKHLSPPATVAEEEARSRSYEVSCPDCVEGKITAGCSIDKPLISVDCGKCKGTGKVSLPTINLPFSMDDIRRNASAPVQPVAAPQGNQGILSSPMYQRYARLWSSTEGVERRYDLQDRYMAVRSFVHAIDYIAEHERDFLIRANAQSVLRDGIYNALDHRATGREWRNIRHTYQNERDGPHPPNPAEEDRRCERCGAIRPEPFTHCHAKNHVPTAAVPPTEATQVAVEALQDLFALVERQSDGRWCFKSLSRDASKFDAVMERLSAMPAPADAGEVERLRGIIRGQRETIKHWQHHVQITSRLLGCYAMDKDVEAAIDKLKHELATARATAIRECVNAIITVRNSTERPTDQLVGFDYAIEVLESLAKEEDDGPTDKA